MLQLITEDQESLSSMELCAADGQSVPLSRWQDQVLLIVNVASKCGFTGQYAALQELYERYSEQGFTVLAFPCNQFANQESGDDASIQEFCRTKFSVTFPVLAKCNVNGPQALPLFKLLSSRAKGALGSSRIKWNFTKFLINRNFTEVKRFAPATSPAKLAQHIEDWL